MSEITYCSNSVPAVGGMATMPSRAHNLPRVLGSVLPQVDQLYLYLDHYDRVPEFVINHPKIVPILPSLYGSLGSNGKFLGACLHPEPCRYFCFDDDILYPDRHVEVLSRALARHKGRALVGFHGALFKAPHASYLRDRTIFHFAKGLGCEKEVDVIGTGTAAFHTGTLDVDSRCWPERNMDDLILAIEAARRGLPRILVPRPPGFLVALEESQGDSLWRGLNMDDSRQTRIMQQALESLAGSWQRSVAGQPDGPKSGCWKKIVTRCLPLNGRWFKGN